MKQFVIALALFTIFSTQKVYAQHFMAGLSLGPTVTDVQGMDTKDFDNDFLKVGFSGGAFVNRQFGDKNIIQLEINYVQKGTEQLPDSTNNGYFKLGLNYIEVPILIRHRVHINISKKFYNNFEWEAGLSGGYLFSYTYVNNGYDILLPTNSINTVDVSVLLGINYIISPRFYFGVRYSNSVIPVIKHSAIPAQSFSSYPFAFNNGDNMVYQFCFKYVIAGSSDK